MPLRSSRHTPLTPPSEHAPGAAEGYRKRLLKAVNELPPLSAVLNQLLQVLNSADISSGQVASLIEKDSVLSGSVLRCVNSAYYGLPARVSSIRHAVTLLGFGTVRNLALAFSMRRMLHGSRVPPQEIYAAYSQHALGCAIMTQFLATFTRSEQLDAAFAAGLFHDIGKLLIFSIASETVPAITNHWQGNDCSYEEAERAVLGVSHSELSLAVLESWKLPESIQAAGRYHHHPDENPDYVAGEPFTLAHLVHAADRFANAYGLQIMTSPDKPPESPIEAFRKLGLEERLPEIEQQFRTELDSVRELFGG